MSDSTNNATPPPEFKERRRQSRRSGDVSLSMLERASKWIQALTIVVLTAIGAAVWLFTSAAKIAEVPKQIEAINAANQRQDSAARAMRMELDSVRIAMQRYVAEAGAQDRAQTCMLMQLTRKLDPSGCEFFLPNPSYYNPPRQ